MHLGFKNLFKQELIDFFLLSVVLLFVVVVVVAEANKKCSCKTWKKNWLSK